MTADFNWFLNKQGPRGQQGVRGEQGFSPVITVAEDTAKAYILRIQTQDDTFLTPNLRGTVDDLGGTYVRYNPETGQVYAGSPDIATTETFGVIRLASAQDVTDLSQDAVVTPNDVNNMVNSSSTIADLQNQININKNDINTIQGNYVTTDTTQTISGNKTFTGAEYEFTQQNGQVIFKGRVKAINIQEPYHGSNLIDYGEQGSTRIITLGSTQDKVVIKPDLKVQKSGTEYDVISSNDIASIGKAGIVKPDGSTVFIDENGVISATGGGGETDAYTKAETDELLGEKADKFTTSAPLTISEKSDAEYDGTITNGTISFDGVNSFTTISDVLYAGAHDGDRITRYVALPLDVNTIVKAPIMGNFNNTSEYGQIREQVLLGDFDNEGKFIPYVGILNESRVNNRYGRMNGGTTISNINPNGAHGLSFTYTSPSSHKHAAYNLETATPDDAPIENQSIYIEKYISDTGELAMGLWTVGDVDGSSIDNMVSTTFDGSIGTELQEACKKSKWVLFSPASNGLTPNIGDFKIYETNGRHGWNKAGLLSGITNAPYKQPLVSSTANIALSVDNSTIKVNDNGQLYAVAQESPAPSNMVTTDTEQTITGKKTFTNKIQVGTLSQNLIYTYNDILQIGARNIIASEIAVNADIIKDRDGNEYLKYSYNAFKQVKLTQSEYDALATKDDNTMYIIVG